ncbi:uncharacterized protein LACBIDRAFT_335256 [Laccaria bicolor S238N-H82]|uniref:Predicted protein n=1 Tax=Laccaria bicolor (strain S238N-H82 / ATCC MYA-4686) TaxID=486041 RepID=B0E1U2_LACBS|nr:uncharacterized protein LACBIDRAFT_335256 [Laccaria bicolor S238N-H82]EDQ99198.1 predicted protein [Laccaria bicolor S238N-H82]|eukprot:XP_001890165.1 predicted protein [Laccaria bicolor S238N-H82]
MADINEGCLLAVFLILLEEGHHHPVHLPHSATRSFQGTRQTSIQTPSPTTAQTTTTMSRKTTKECGSNVPDHPPHPSPISQRTSSKEWASAYERPAHACSALIQHEPRTFCLPTLAYLFSFESLDYATQLGFFSHAYNGYVVFPPLLARLDLCMPSSYLPGTLLMIAKRCDKLDKWTMGHVRALEDRMNEVERWGTALGYGKNRNGTLSAEPKTQSAAVSMLVATQTTSSIVTHSHPTSSIATHLTGSPSAPSTPIYHLRKTSKRKESGTRLPSPTGDYSSAPDTFSPFRYEGLCLRPFRGYPSIYPQDWVYYQVLRTLPPHFPRWLPVRFAPASSSANRTASPTPAPAKGRGTQGLPPPKSAAGKRQTSVSPTPRKRYTVALGGPITALPDEDEFSSNAASLFYSTAANTNANINTHTDLPSTAPLLKRVGTPRSYSRVIGGSFSVSPVGDDDDDKKKEEEGAGEFGEGEETIGKSSGIKLKNANGSLVSTTSNSISPGGPGGGDYKSTATTSPSPSTRRIRAQSAYEYASLLPPQAPTMGTTALLKPKLRSRSSERLSSGTSSIGTGDGMISGGLGGGGTKFVDPLLLRRHQQSQEGLQVKMPMPKPVGKVPIGWLVAFFDGEKGGRT